MTRTGLVPIFLFLAGLPLQAFAPASVLAQETFKCRDKAGGVVYSNERCEKQGLRDGGPVRERLTTMPATSPTGNPPAAKGARPARKDEAEDATRTPPRIQPINPLIEKIAK